MLPSFDPSQQRTILRAREYRISSQLSIIPLERSQFNLLSAQEFRDGLALKPLLCLPPCCDCHIGGLVGWQHNKGQDAFGDLDPLVWNPVLKEPLMVFLSHLLQICVCMGFGSDAVFNISG